MFFFSHQTGDGKPGELTNFTRPRYARFSCHEALELRPELGDFWRSGIETSAEIGDITLWLCQNSYWKWPLIVDFPIKNGDFQ